MFGEAAVIAIVLLVGVFTLIAIALFKSGVEGALKLWSGMGAVTGVAIGAIVSFYFTDQLNREEIDGLEAARAAHEADADSARSGARLAGELFETYKRDTERTLQQLVARKSQVTDQDFKPLRLKLEATELKIREAVAVPPRKLSLEGKAVPLRKFEAQPAPKP